MRNTCPSCHVEYVVTPADVGRRIRCKQCQTTLVVAPDGLELEPQPVAGQEKPPLTQRVGDLGDLRRRVDRIADGPTLLFGLGAVLVIFFLFMPLIGKAKIDRRIAELNQRTADHAAEMKALRAKPGNEQKVQEHEDQWQKRQDELQDAVKQAEYANAESTYLDRYGLMLGFLLVAAGALGFLQHGPTATKRIVGAVVIAAQMLLAFVRFVIGVG